MTTTTSQIETETEIDIETDVAGPVPDVPTDPEIKRGLLDALPKDIGVSVTDAWAVIEGTVEWQYQKFEDERVAYAQPGVRGVTNLIAVKTALSPEEMADFIANGLFRNLEASAARITVEVIGSQVILRGKVHSWPERDEAGRTAAFAPGVTAVDNRVTVTFDLPEGN